MFELNRRYQAMTVIVAAGMLSACGGASQAIQPLSFPVASSARIPDTTGQPFLIASFGTVYAANKTFTTLTPVQVAPNGGLLINATAVGPNGELLISNCTQMGENSQDYYKGMLGPGACITGETDIYSAGNQQPVVIPGYGGNGVGVARDGRFVTSSGNPGCNICYGAVNEFNPGQTSPSLTIMPAQTPATAPFASISAKGNKVYVNNFGSSNYCVCVYPWLRSAPSFQYDAVGYSGSSVGPSGTFYEIVQGSQNVGPSGLTCTGGSVGVFPSGSQHAAYSITASINCPVGATVFNGNLYVANAGPTPSQASVTVYPVGQTTLKASHGLPWIPTSLSRSTEI